MSWPLVFIRFLLASASRLEDHGTPYEELLCRMLGEGTDETCPTDLADAGCGCPIQPPPAYSPEFDPAKAVKVGWEDALEENTAITYSFEKEWDGDAPELYRLYEPAGEFCEQLWAQLDDAQKREFMTRYWLLENSDPRPWRLEKYFKFRRDNDCCLGDDSHNNYIRRWLPLRRSASAPDSISSLVEADGKPWETKASTFYYDLGTMEEAVTSMLPFLDVPPTEQSPDGFPAERRIQVHVVAPLKRVGDDDRTGLVPHSRNPELHQGLRLIQLFFSDFMFLRLGFPHGPKGEGCSGLSGQFKCDVFTDAHNDVIDTEDADLALSTSRLIRGHKFAIVGLRTGEVYGGVKDNCTRADDDDCSTPFRVGFEIRKSASFQEAVDVSKAIGRALSSMTPAGVTRVGVKEEASIDIGTVRDFAQWYRFPLRFPWRDRQLDPWMEKRKAQTRLTMPLREFCSDEAQDRDRGGSWRSTVKMLAAHFYEDSPTALKKLWKMLALVLCSDWTKLVGASAPRPDDVHTVFEKLRDSGRGVWSKNMDQSFQKPFREEMDRFRVMVAQYAFRLSEHF